ncbi:MAG: ATP-binding protein [Candidatus Eisenbacteria bacterium]
MLSNLIHNALKFTEKGFVRVEASRLPADADTPDDRVRVAVTDSGPGIPASHRSAVFEMFHQVDGSTRRRFGGTGLGLAICKKLVERMGGEIGCESEPTRGATFWFTLPCRASGSEAQPEAPTLEGVPALVVHPNETERTLLCEQLALWGLRCQATASAHDALRLLRGPEAPVPPVRLVVVEQRAAEIGGQPLPALLGEVPALAELAVVLVGDKARGTMLPGTAVPSRTVRAVSRPLARPSQLRDALVSVLEARPLLPTWAGLPAPEETDLVPDPEAPRLRVLLAEDNTTNAKLALRILEREGCRVDVVTNGREAVDLATRLPYDMIFMDCHMPEMDGLDATAAIRRWESTRPDSSASAGGSFRSRVPIIAVTASAMASDREACRVAGMDDFISKPLRKGDLHFALANWCAAAKAA